MAGREWVFASISNPSAYNLLFGKPNGLCQDSQPLTEKGWDTLKNALTTEKIWSTRFIHMDQNAPGYYSDERTDIHDRIIKKTLKGVAPSEHPFAIIIAGGPTAGKSTLITALKKSGIIPKEGMVTINKPPFAQLPEFHKYETLRHPEKVLSLVDEYYDLMHYILEAAIEKKMPILLEEHCNEEYRTMEAIKKLKAAGYQVALIGVTTDVESYFRHENRRCEKEHREPDHPWALACHGDLAECWETYIDACDISLLCKRNASGPPISIIARAEKGPDDKTHQTILDEGLYYDTFKQWETVNTQATCAAEAFPAANREGHSRNQPGAVGRSRERGEQGRRDSIKAIAERVDSDLPFVKKIAQFADQASKSPLK